MKLKAVSGIMLILLLIGMLTLAFNIGPVKASGTIYIRSDGSVDPSTANITSLDNVTYTFTGNIYDEIFVERDNIIVDGAGYTLQGTGALGSRGIDLTGRSNVTIKNMKIKTFWTGIGLKESSNNTISGNTITANENGGISLYLYANNNTISENTVTNNGGRGISLGRCSHNSIYHNNFMDNTEQVTIDESTNVWDDGYPSGGNYWSDYTDVDVKSGPYQNETGSDRIGDTPYIIDEYNQDYYPLMEPWSPPPSILGDLNNDGIVDVSDVVIAGKAFGSYPGHPRWDSRADINTDDVVDIFDLVLIVKKFGKTA